MLLAIHHTRLAASCFTAKVFVWGFFSLCLESFSRPTHRHNAERFEICPPHLTPKALGEQWATAVPPPPSETLNTESKQVGTGTILQFGLTWPGIEPKTYQSQGDTQPLGH